MNTYQEIEALIESVGGVRKLMDYSGLENFPQYNTISVKNEYDEGNESLEKVLHFTDSDIYIRVTGYFDSYDGTHWDKKFTQVFPKETVVTIYVTE